ncbi:beta-N-acetylhexosaminidase OS=Rhodanobacter lindaniclasticus OX=75310 GN=B1991_05515 PE=3 SV=1 [Rhodanobacter lindaniclasticus]
MESLHDVYGFQAIPGVLDAGQAKHVLGVQANLWTERCVPAARRTGQVAWSPQASRDWPGFLARLPAQLARYRAQGIGYADGAFAVDIATDRNLALATGRATVTLANQAGFGAIHYTLDGSVPTPASPHYDAPFTVTLPATVRAASFVADGSALAAPRERVLTAPPCAACPATPCRTAPAATSACACNRCPTPPAPSRCTR